jgi:ATP-dependent DNA helicase PIF1
MLAGEFFDKVEYVARKIREDERPFGGIQVVLCGDFLQLPPVMAKHLCFECECWPRVVQKSVELTQVTSSRSINAQCALGF